MKPNGDLTLTGPSVSTTHSFGESVRVGRYHSVNVGLLSFNTYLSSSICA